MSHVLIVDDEPSICWGFREFLSEAGHEVSIAASAEDALGLAEEQRPDAVVLDVRLPGMDGLTAIEQLRRRFGDVPIIVITAFGNLDTAVRAVKEGAFDYLPKPFDLDQAAEIVGRALRAASAPETQSLRGTDSRATDAVDSLIGSSPDMQAVFKQIALVADSDVPVLITGESGTGKELVARAIHRHSRRGDGPFVPVCLAALSPGVVESELFGHVRGAFTGADVDRRGLLELAAGGTVLLDEIADTSNALQVKLLRTLEQREVTPVGESLPRPIDVRVIAATNRSLPELIAEGEFREDFYFRLSVFRIHLPPLRARRQDIPELARHFLQSSLPEGAGGELSQEVLDALLPRDWPGNVRELRNAIEHAAVVARGNPIRPEDLPPPASHLSPAAAGPVDIVRERMSEWARLEALSESAADGEGELYERFLSVAEPPLLRAVLEACAGNRAAAARMLGIHRTTLRQKLRRHGID